MSGGYIVIVTRRLVSSRRALCEEFLSNSCLFPDNQLMNRWHGPDGVGELVWHAGAWHAFVILVEAPPPLPVVEIPRDDWRREFSLTRYIPPSGDAPGRREGQGELAP